MSKAKILAYEYADKCNVIVGCSGCELSKLNGIGICWAERIFNRFSQGFPKNRDFYDWQFYPDKLKVLNRKEGGFFGNFMGDAFCSDSQFAYYLQDEDEYFAHILDRLEKNPQSHLILSTKWPENIPNDFPQLPNLWLMTSIDGNFANGYRRLRSMANIDYANKILSYEPILDAEIDEDLEGLQSNFKWIIIGGISGGKHIIPREQIEDMTNRIKTPVFIKSNIYEFRGKPIPGFEGFKPRKEFPISPIPTVRGEKTGEKAER